MTENFAGTRSGWGKLVLPDSQADYINTLSEDNATLLESINAKKARLSAAPLAGVTLFRTIRSDRVVVGAVAVAHVDHAIVAGDELLECRSTYCFRKHSSMLRSMRHHCPRGRGAYSPLCHQRGPRCLRTRHSACRNPMHCRSGAKAYPRRRWWFRSSYSRSLEPKSPYRSW